MWRGIYTTCVSLEGKGLNYFHFSKEAACLSTQAWVSRQREDKAFCLAGAAMEKVASFQITDKVCLFLDLSLETL